MPEERVPKVFLEADFKEALSLYEQVQTFALHLRGETKEIDPANGQTKQIHVESVEIGRVRAAVALGCIPPIAMLNGQDELSHEDKLALRIRERCTGDFYEANLAALNDLVLIVRSDEQLRPGEILRNLESGTIVKLNGIPLELACNTPVRGDVEFALEQGKGPFTGDGSDPKNPDVSREFTSEEVTRDDSDAVKKQDVVNVSSTQSAAGVELSSAVIQRGVNGKPFELIRIPPHSYPPDEAEQLRRQSLSEESSAQDLSATESARIIQHIDNVFGAPPGRIPGQIDNSQSEQAETQAQTSQSQATKADFIK